jgi:hypothetical protein
MVFPKYLYLVTHYVIVSAILTAVEEQHKEIHHTMSVGSRSSGIVFGSVAS